jgi:rhodanese-related sulfurtransferase
MPSSTVLKAAALSADIAIGIMLLATAYALRPSGYGPRPLEETRPTDLVSVHGGQVLVVPGVEWKRAPRSVVLLIRTSCPFCNKSAAFYSRLSHAVSQGSWTRLIVVTGPANKGQIAGWLQANQIQANEVAVAPSPLALGFRRTPTLLIVDASGVISDVFVGMASPAEEQRILQRIRGEGPALNRTFMPPAISDAASLDGALRANAQLIDIREREAFRLGHHAGAMSIPAPELRVRGPIELTATGRTIVDCSQVAPLRCVRAANRLFEVGFEHVLASTVR